MHLITGSPVVLDELGSFKAPHENYTILKAIVHGVENDRMQMERLITQLTTEAGVLQANWKPLATAKAGKRTVSSDPIA